MSSLLEAMSLPAFARQRVSIADIEQFSNADKEEKRILEKSVSSIYLVSVLNKETIKARPYLDENYSYQTIYVLEIELKTDKSISEVSKIIHSAFAEPVIVIINQENKSYISLATKRINKVDKTKTVIEEHVLEEINVNYYNYLDLNKLSASDLKDLYFKYADNIYKIRLNKIVKVEVRDDIRNLKEKIDRYQKLNSEIDLLKEKYKSVSMLKDKIQIDNKIFECEQKQKEIINELKGEY